jgi:peptide deformylase
MAVRNVVQEGDSILRKKCFEVTEFNGKLFQLLDDLKDTVLNENGAGLAAPQVGVLRRVVVINLEEGYFELINPVIVSSKGSQTDYEGCLSVKGKKGIVTRPNDVKVKAFDRNGKLFKLSTKGYLARAVCHELDHLDGILYIDKADSIEIER